MFRGALLLAALSVAGAADVPNPIYAASDYSKLTKSVPDGALYHVAAPGAASMDVMHLYGNATQRGVAHGRLLSDEILDFLETDLIVRTRARVLCVFVVCRGVPCGVKLGGGINSAVSNACNPGATACYIDEVLRTAAHPHSHPPTPPHRSYNPFPFYPLTHAFPHTVHASQRSNSTRTRLIRSL